MQYYSVFAEFIDIVSISIIIENIKKKYPIF
jgi:hypothetical protein